MTKTLRNPIAKWLEAIAIVLLLLFYSGIQAGIGAPLFGAMNTISYGILLILIAWRWKRIAYALTKAPLLWILIGLAILSILWSAESDITLIEVRPLVRSTLIGVYLACCYSAKQQMIIFACVMGGVLLLSLPDITTAFAVAPEFWAGAIGFKNLFSCITMLSALVFLLIALDKPKQRWIALVAIALSLAFLVLSQGKTSVVALAVGLGLLPIRGIVGRHYKLRIALLLSSLLIIGGATTLFVENAEFIFVNLLGKNLEFNGRLPIWNLMFDSIGQRPWLGYGYSGFWTSDYGRFIADNSWAAGGNADDKFRFNAHNGYIDLILQLGLAGFSVYLIHTGTALLRVLKLLVLTKSVEHFWMLQYMICLLLSNLADSLSIVSPSSLWSFSTAIALTTAMQDSYIRAQVAKSRFRQATGI